MRCGWSYPLIRTMKVMPLLSNSKGKEEQIRSVKQLVLRTKDGLFIQVLRILTSFRPALVWSQGLNFPW